MKLVWLLIYSLPLQLLGQVTYQSSQEIENSLKGFSSNLELNRYLWNNGYLHREFHPCSEQDSVVFEVGNFEVDIFRKNLLGSPTEEAIVQIRSSRHWSVVVFSRVAKLWVKIPGCLAPSSDRWTYKLGDTYVNCKGTNFSKFTFQFVSILSAKHFHIISRNTEDCAKAELTVKILWNITEDSISRELSWLEQGFCRNSHNYGVDQIIHTVKTEFEIEQTDTYPRSLQIHTVSEKEELWNVKRNSNGEVIDSTGRLVIKHTSITYYPDPKAPLFFVKTKEENRSNVRYIGRPRQN